MMYGLGRKPSPPDSRDYRLADFLPRRFPDFAHDMAVWATGKGLDQGATPHCCGFAGAHWTNAEPVPNTWAADDAHDLYYECKVIDGEPGAENGSYIRTVAKALRARGRIDKYAFGSLLDARAFLLESGPVVFGLDWYESMFYPDTEGTIRPGGELCGGHAILAYGADPTYCHFQNSWGTRWGDGGLCRMTWDDLAVAYGEGGEAMAAVETPLDWTPPVLPWWTRLWRFILGLLGRG